MKFLGSAKLATKSQITLPKAVRERLKIGKGDDVIFLLDENGIIFITNEVEISCPRNKET